MSPVNAYERMCGVHLSLGGKHVIYSRKGKEPADGRHHVDVFVALDRVEIDGQVVFRDGAYAWPG